MPGSPGQLEQTTSADLASEVRQGLGQLLRAFDYARDLECSLWDFSIEIDRLLALGMTTSDLRWLIKRGYLSHAREITGPHDADRRFDPQSQNLAFSKGTCFVLTALGLALLGREPCTDETASTELLSVLHRPEPATVSMAAPGMAIVRDDSPRFASESSGLSRATLGSLQSAGNITVTPRWDKALRTFLVGEHLVKHFRVPSPNQEAILDAFQEEGWPRSVDDPLPPVSEQHPKRRLRDTVKGLNMHQISPLIRFRGDGTGQRVTWELLAASAAPAKSSGQPRRRAA